MQVQVANDAAASVNADALVVPVFVGAALDGAAAEVDAALGGAVSDVLASGEMTGKINETSLVHAKDASFKRVLIVGLGDRAKLTVGTLSKYGGTAVRRLGKRGVHHIAFVLPEGVDPSHAASFIVEGAIAGSEP